MTSTAEPSSHLHPAIANARRVLVALEAQAAGYTSLTIPAHLQIELEDQRRRVQELEVRLKMGTSLAKLPAIPTQPGAPIHPNNLPASLNSFVGRENDILLIRQMLLQPNVRFLSLTGMGGIGKTRLSLQVAASLLEDFSQGIFFVPLAKITDPVMVEPTIAQALGIQLNPGQSPLEALKNSLSDKQLLLILDNVEQVEQAIPAISDLLTVAPKLKIMATSRVLLKVYGEYNYPVTSLAVPDPKQRLSPALLQTSAAIRLFVERVQAVKPDFVLTDENVSAVVEICRRLDGLPLAIELAAALIRFFSPRQMAAEMKNRLRLLVGGSKNLPDRQQTLRKTIEWSYHLLDAPGKILFEQMAVFVGGGKLNAINAVCYSDREIIQGLTMLLDHNLLRQYGDLEGQRFEMLELTREYALECLTGNIKQNRLTRQRHAQYYAILAEDIEKHLLGSQQTEWWGELDMEHGNILAALEWTLDCEEIEHVELGLRIASAMSFFWGLRGYRVIRKDWLNKSLGKMSGTSKSVTAKLLWACGYYEDVVPLAQRTGFMEESLRLYRSLDDKRGIANALCGLGRVSSIQSDYERATQLLEESLALSIEINNVWGIMMTLRYLGENIVNGRGDYSRAAELYQELRIRAHETGDRWSYTRALMGLGRVALKQKDWKRAEKCYSESLSHSREMGDKWGEYISGEDLGRLLLYHGEYEQAAMFFEENLKLAQEFKYEGWIRDTSICWGLVAFRQKDFQRAKTFFKQYLSCQNISLDEYLALCLAGLSAIIKIEGESERAFLWFGVAESLMRTAEVPLDFIEQAEWEYHKGIVLDQAGKQIESTLGDQISLEQIIEFVTQNLE